MMCLAQNRQSVWYATLTGSEPLRDADGNYTGDYATQYSEPQRHDMNVSAAKTDSQYQPFGIDTPYDKLAVTDWMGCPIKEDSVMWVGKNPEDGEHNYTVRRIARSLNSIMYALSEVDVNA